MAVSCNVPKVQFPMHLSSLRACFMGFHLSVGQTPICRVEKPLNGSVKVAACTKAKLTLVCSNIAVFVRFFERNFSSFVLRAAYAAGMKRVSELFYACTRARWKIDPQVHYMCRAMKTVLFCQHLGTFVIYLLKLYGERWLQFYCHIYITSKPPLASRRMHKGL